MRKQQAEVGKSYRTALVPELRSIDEKSRTIEFVASTEAEDRYGDVIRTSGWQFSNYLRNPVFLFGHKSGEPPIGRTVELKIETSPVPALVQRVRFADAVTYAFADTIFNLYKGGYMRAVSVGFMPTEQPTPIYGLDGQTGWEFNGQELLELSAVSLPANPEALARCVQKGFDEADLARVFGATSSEDFYRELISINQEISSIAVGLATATVRQSLAALKAAGIRPSKPKTDITTLDELDGVFRGNSVADLIVRFVETEGGSRCAE
jgi:phage head maturation protease